MEKGDLKTFKENFRMYDFVTNDYYMLIFA